MAAYNFPNSPSDGDTVTSNGITYTYSSSKTRWDGAAPSGSSTTVYATIDDLPLSGASTGDQAYVSGNNRLYIWNGTGWYNIALINTTPSISGANASYALAVDGTATTVTITATDPEGIPITYSIASDTSGNVATVTQGTGANTNVFTITPSTNTANAGTFSLTFRASDGVNIATAVSSFTLQFSISNSNYTTALITSVGANNAVNNSFTDSSTNSHTITANGNATQSTFSPYRHGGYSTYFDGSGDYLTVPDDTSLDFGTGDFTVECWINLPERSSGNPIIFGSSWYIQLKTGDTKISFWGGGGTEQVYTGTALELNRWYHIAVVRDSGQITMYLDGSSILSSAYTTSVNTATNVSIGRSTSTAFYFKGYIRDVRVVKGSAIVPSSGGPSEPLTAVTNTSLLTCHLPYIADGSTNSHSITVNGNTKTEPLSPYDYRTYSASSNGGSMYFDGTGDYLSMSHDSSLKPSTSGAFSIEFWYYAETNGTTRQLAGDFKIISYPSNCNGFDILENNDNSVRLRWGNPTYQNIGAGASETLKAGQWHHIAVCRDAEATPTISLFVNGVRTGTTTSNTGITDSTLSNFYLGWAGSQSGTTIPPALGNICDVRMLKGSTAYDPTQTTLTVPAAPLTAITNTSLLLNGTDAGIIDKSQSVKTITLNGDVKSSTTQSKYLTSSMYFDGTGDAIASSDRAELGTGDFTLEAWIYPTTLNANDAIIAEHWGGTTAGFILRAHTSNYLSLFDGTTNRASSTAIVTNQWQHVAASRESGTLKLFINGTQVLSVATSSSLTGPASGESVTVGAITNSSGFANYFTGYISDVRITKGLARYTAVDETANIPSAALQG